MDIILTQDLEHLGRSGEVVKVKDGYARNYLLPRQLAMAATASNIKRMEKDRARREALYQEQKQQAQARAAELSKVSLTMAVEVNDQEKLYGAVTDAEILKALETEGQKVDKKSLVVAKAIEELGIFEVGVKLHPEVTAKVRLWVTKK